LGNKAFYIIVAVICARYGKSSVHILKNPIAAAAPKLRLEAFFTESASITQSGWDVQTSARTAHARDTGDCASARYRDRWPPGASLANDWARPVVAAGDDTQSARHKFSRAHHILGRRAAGALHQFAEIVDLPAALAPHLAFHLAH
jgi:hypothetical protein